MSSSDLLSFLQWYFMFFLIGIVFFPLTSKLFALFIDMGYGLSKILGVLLTSYLVFVLSMTRIFQFNILTILITIVALGAVSTFLTIRPLHNPKKRFKDFLKTNWGVLVFEEVLFFIALYFMAYIRAFSPDIHGLEKYMDYGFINSILRSDYFPPVDMWFSPLPINYYYFGHLSTALLTKLSGISSEITYNLMLASIFALAITASFSIVFTFMSSVSKQFLKIRFGLALLSAFILTLGGNLHAMYTFFSPYANESPVPPWQLLFRPLEFPNSYWYPNATRFIYNTIHEFPMYSWTVSDLHGHVLDIPYVLLTLAAIYAFYLFASHKQILHPLSNRKGKIRLLLFLGLLLSVMYMTNAWDGIIYFLLAILVILASEWSLRKDEFIVTRSVLPFLLEKLRRKKKHIFLPFLMSSVMSIGIVGIGFFFFSLPFSIAFKPFVSGIGVLCAPDFLTSIGKIGPFLFEPEHCQPSPFWQLLILHGFFFFFVIVYLFIVWKLKKLTQTDLFVSILIFLSTVLILIPEFIYAKDIYPGHYRANTMFKLVFQSFIMFSLCTGFILYRFILFFHDSKKGVTLFPVITILFSLVLLSTIFIYPFQAINSYYGELKTYKGLDGTSYLQTSYPDDYNGIQWLQKNIKGQPVILEAQGDAYGGASSYTDYARVSANTGIPTVLGWTVHEWLWRGTYDIPAPRIEDVRLLYESTDPNEKNSLLKKYNIEYVFVGTLEREKYPYLAEDYFQTIGENVFSSNTTSIYKINP